MPSSSLHIVLYNWLKPFLEEAKQKGFHVSPDTHIKIAAVLAQCADKIEDETVLFDYFSPIIAKNKEDYQLLKGEWEKWCGREKLINNKKEEPPKPKPRYHWLIASVIGFVLLFGGWFLYLFSSVHTARADYKIYHTDVTQLVQFDAGKSITEIADTARLKFAWNFGDGTTETSTKTTVVHRYSKAQSYTTSLTLLPRDSHVSIVRKQLITPFELCKPALTIAQQPNENATTGKEILFSVNYDWLYPASAETKWTINGETVAENTKTFTTKFDSAGTYNIAYIDSGYVAGTHCDSVTTLAVQVKSSEAANFVVSETGSFPAPPLSVNWHNILALLILVLYLLWQYAKNRKKIKEKNTDPASRSADVMGKLKGAKPPYEIPFKTQDDVIDDEPLLPALAKNFKRRVADENPCLNIPLTIESTIKSEGFLLPVFTQKTKPSEYLILIDKSYVKSAQVKLFEYLVKRFSKSDIFTDTFYFYDKPDYGFNAFYPKGIFISRLYDLYPDHTVIIFGNGHSFIDKYYPALIEASTLPYTKWTNHAIFTPVPYNDWGGKEILLQKRFLLMPADMEGQLLLFNFIDQPETFTSAGLQSLQSSYKAKGFNANKAEKIRKYLDNEFLFQWLCAMAISPSIYWQTMLGIGDALQKERYFNEVIQYSSLLKLVRISWMRDAAFPEEIRLELLKDLEPQNEKIARQAMIKMMDEALLKADENSFAFEELYLQQMTDKFMLYVSNKNSDEYKNYRTAHDEFKALWKDNKITDVVLKEYLKKEDDSDWSTLIGNENLENNPTESVSIDTLFDDHNTALQMKWLKLQNAGILSLIALVVLFAASIFLLKNNWNNTFVNDKLQLVSADSNATVSFTFNVAYNQCFSAVQRQKDATIFTLDFGNNNHLSLSGKDTAKLKKIPAAWLSTKQVALHISSRNEVYQFDSSFLLSSTRLSLSINGCAIYCNQWQPKRTATVDAGYSGDWYDNGIVNGSGTSYASMPIEPNTINGEKIERIEACENNSDLLRIITQNNHSAFSLYYLMQTNANTIGFAVQGTSYETLQSAETDTTGFAMSTRVRLIANTNSFTGSHTFFASAAGKWWANNDSEFIDVSPSQNIVSVNGTNTFTVTAEQQTKTTWGKTLYRLTAVKKDSASATPGYLYFLMPDSLQMMIDFEEKDSAGTQYAQPHISSFEPIRKRSTQLETPATLPQSLNEIWHGSGNRLITLFLPKNVIYYSVNDTKTYGTYNINAVSQLSDGTYKIVTKTNQGYKLFFIKNLSSLSFDLSVCQNFLATKEEAAGKTSADCEAFNTMNLYYENNPEAIYLPVAFSNNLAASQRAKLNKIVTELRNKMATISSINLLLSYTPPNLSKTLSSINSFLQQNGINNKITGKDVIASTTNQPFTRSYIEIKTKAVSNVSPQVQTNSGSDVTQQSNTDVTQQSNTEKNLGVIQFDEKSGTPDSKGLQLIAAIVSQLKKNAASHIRLNAFYSQKGDYTTVQQRTNTLEDLFKKEGVAVSRANNPLQIMTLIQMTTQPATDPKIQSSKAPVSATNHSIIIDVTGINFPENFTASPSQKGN